MKSARERAFCPFISPKLVLVRGILPVQKGGNGTSERLGQKRGSPAVYHLPPAYHSMNYEFFEFVELPEKVGTPIRVFRVHFRIREEIPCK